MIPGRDRRLAVAFALTMCVAVAGCRPGRPRLPLPDTLPAADALLASLAARRHALTSVRGMARVAWERGEERVGARNAVIVAPPDRFRLEAMSPLGALAVVTSDGRELAVWVRREHRTYRGPATAESVAAYTGLSIDVADVASLLLGLPPERRVVAPPALALDDVTGFLRVSAAVEGGRQDVWFARDSRLPVASETSIDAGHVLRVDLDDYRSIGGGDFPLAIDARVLPDGGRIRVRWEPPTIGAVIQDDVFAFPARPGVDEVRLDRYRGGDPP